MGGGVSTLPEDVLAEFNELEEEEKALVQGKYEELIEGGTESKAAMNSLIAEFSTANAQGPVFSDAIFLIIKQAKDLKNTNFIGTIDPFVEISIPAYTGCIGTEKGSPWKSSIVKDSVNPEWNEKVTFLLNPIVDMINIDIKGNRRSKLGSVQIQIDRSTPFRGKEVWYDFGEGSQILIEQVYAPLTLANTFSEKYVNLTAQLEETLMNQEASDDAKIAALTGQVEVLKGEKESEKQVYEETIANLRKEIEEKNKTMEEMQDDLEEFMKQVEDLEDDVEELEEENEKLEQKNNESLANKAKDASRQAKKALKNQGKKLGKFFRRR